VSNDNPCSESQFKTTKYWPSYPGRLRSDEHARQWGNEFFPACNRRPHESLALSTPEGLHTGQVEFAWQVCEPAQYQHHPAHLERHVKRPARVARPPTFVSINPDDGQTAAALLDNPDAFQLSPTPVSAELPAVVTQKTLLRYWG